MPWLETRLSEGELWIRGKPVCRAYHNGPPALDRDGWFHTGDLFDLDADGRLVFRGRAVEVINVGGFNVYPAEVERVLAAHPSVQQAVVVGVPDPRLGSVPLAFVQMRAGMTLEPDSLEALCRERLSGYKVPREFRVVDSIPVNGAGKVERYKLREMAAP